MTLIGGNLGQGKRPEGRSKRYMSAGLYPGSSQVSEER